MQCENCRKEISNIVLVNRPPGINITRLTTLTVANRIFCSEKCWEEQQVKESRRHSQA